jgi:hypothetical protein
VIHCAEEKTGVDIYLGVGGAPEGVLAAAALRCISGQMQARDRQQGAARAQGCARVHRILYRCPAMHCLVVLTRSIALCLEVLGLTDLFQGWVFSTSNVARGKPYPDIFLHAAQQLGVNAADCVVIEDSVGGVMAACAAGATAIGFTAASHIQTGHDSRLRDAGAHHVVRSFEELEKTIRNGPQRASTTPALKATKHADRTC